MNVLVSGLFCITLLCVGVLLASIADQCVQNVFAGRKPGTRLLDPFRSLVVASLTQRTRTEAPDEWLWRLAPVWYLSLALIGLATVPVGKAQAVIGFEASVVLWGTVEALTVVVVFLHGWSPNSPLALMGAYRYVAVGLPIMLISMFVLIGAALPAESLDLRQIVISQSSQWNLVRQPLGLPLFLLLGLSLSLRGPMNYADSSDLSGGTSVEDSGSTRLCWQLARLCILVSFSAVAATVFLGGYLGPVLPGPLWLALKTMIVLLVLVVLTHALARLPVSRMLGLIWKVLLPLGFVALVQAGVQAL